MAHPEQSQFCKSVKDKFPEKFKDCSVLDIGSLDINGNNRYLFEGKFSYLGVDVGEGKNVDIVSRGHEFNPGRQYDIVISTECFEHDQHWKDTITNCIRLTKSGGLFMFTCATTGRQEHGTTRTTPQDSPFTHKLFNNYYMNLTEHDVRQIRGCVGYDVGFDESFTEKAFSTNDRTKDLYFYGIKK
jgi:cyclopropane fatty-acyl-phospholipid synthase-like methyltransferase